MLDQKNSAILRVYAVLSAISPVLFNNTTSSMLISGQHTVSVGNITDYYRDWNVSAFFASPNFLAYNY